MKTWRWIGIAGLSVGAMTSASADGLSVPGPESREVAPGIWMIPGGIRPERQPDGNSIIFDSPAGLVVVDTGRHAWHRDAIVELAQARQKKIVAIVNTHWHLDHLSGNPALRAAYPDLRVYASDAIDGALEGFLAQSASDAAGYLADRAIAETMREDIRSDVSTIQNGKALKPDTVIANSGAMTLGGRALTINLARNAVTAADVWVHDAQSRLVVLGDLVTLPAPFLDTACPQGWLRALHQVAATDFEVAIPGHGPLLNRAQFQLYRSALEAFVGCANSTRPREECPIQWADSVQSLLSREREQALGLATYYVGMLRANGGSSQYCAVPESPPYKRATVAPPDRSGAASTALVHRVSVQPPS